MLINIFTFGCRGVFAFLRLFLSSFLLLCFSWINGYAAEKVVLQLRWDHQFQFAGYYAAKWQGYYQEAGLDVEIRSAITEDGKILGTIEEVDNGRADFGIGSADILIARDAGKPLVITCVIFQESAAEYYALEGTKLSTPSDFLKMKVARRVNDLIDVELQSMLSAEGIDPRLVKAYLHETGLQHLLSGAVDVIPGYRISAPYSAEAENLTLVSIRPSSFGINFYGDSLFTSERLIVEQPKLVKRFTEATLKGWLYAMSYGSEIAKKNKCRVATCC